MLKQEILFLFFLEIFNTLFLVNIQIIIFECGVQLIL